MKINEIINEGVLDIIKSTLVSWATRVGQAIATVMSRLTFGKRYEINVSNYSRQFMREETNSKGDVGTKSEIVCCYKLAFLLRQSGFRISYDNIRILKNQAKLTLGTVNEEDYQKIEKLSTELAHIIWGDIYLSDDVAFTEFYIKIEHAGGSHQTADMKIILSKDNQTTVAKTILLSLKTTQEGNRTTTFDNSKVGFLLWWLFVNPSTTKAELERMNYDELLKRVFKETGTSDDIYKQYLAINNKATNISRGGIRGMQNFHQQYGSSKWTDDLSKVFLRVFTNGQNKMASSSEKKKLLKEIVFNLLGIGSMDNVYYAILEKNGMVTAGSKNTSRQLKELYEHIKSELDISFSSTGNNGGGIKITLTHNNVEVCSNIISMTLRAPSASAYKNKNDKRWDMSIQSSLKFADQ